MTDDTTQAYLIAASVCGRRRIDSKIVVTGEDLVSRTIGLLCGGLCLDLKAVWGYPYHISWMRHGWDGGIVRVEELPLDRFKLTVRAVPIDVPEGRVFKKLSLTIRTLYIPCFCDELIGMCREVAE